MRRRSRRSSASRRRLRHRVARDGWRQWARRQNTKSPPPRRCATFAGWRRREDGCRAAGYAMTIAANTLSRALGSVLTGPAPTPPARRSDLGRGLLATLVLAVVFGLAARVIELRPLELLRDAGNI